jgi:CheY-like chemotaxis protein
MKNILVVDDDEDDKLLFCTAVESIDSTISCHTAADGLEALHILQTNVLVFPDYIFLDLNMPKMDGFTFLRELKKTVGLRTIPVVIYTTSSNERDIALCKGLGADFFISKPNRISDIHMIIQALLSSDMHSSVAGKHIKKLSSN